MGATAGIDYRLLGPIEAGVDGQVLDIGGQKQRALLAILVLSANEPVPRDTLVDRLWGEHPPAGAQHTLEVYISRLRKTLESAAGGQVVFTKPGAYVLRSASENIDLYRFERLAVAGRRALAADAPEQAAADLREALALWRGAPLADIGDNRFAHPDIARLEELRASAIEDRIEAAVALGLHADVISELGALVAAHPLRERLYELQMIALYRRGHQSEALAVYRTARRVLVEELGIEPSPALKRIERAILAQDPSLDLPPRPAPAADPEQDPGGHSPRAVGRRRVRVSAAGIGSALVLALLYFGGEPHASSVPLSAPADSVAVISTSQAALTKVVNGVGRPGGIAFGAGATWVTDTAHDMVLRISQAGRVVDPIPVGSGPVGVVAAAGEIWVANEFDNDVSEINPPAGSVVARIGVGTGPAWLTYGYGSIWVANVTDMTLSKINPGTGKVTATISLGSVPAGIVAGDGGIWALSGEPGRLVLVDPRSDRVTRAVQLGGSPDGVAVGGGWLWVSGSNGTVTRVDPASGRTLVIRAGGSPAGIAFADGQVWVANMYGSVLRINPRTRAVRSIRVGNEPSSVAAAGGNVLATVLPSLASHRGGTLTLDASFTETHEGQLTSDPAVAWDSWDWQMLTMTNDGLVGFRRVGGPLGYELVPDLARNLPASKDGTTFTFHLRTGIRYSTGQPVRAGDVRRAIERAFIVNRGGGPAPYFYSGIVGARACERRPLRCSLARGIVTDDRAGTVTFHLTSPDPEFLDKLALPFADAIPAGTPDHVLNASQIPATGPYMTRSLRPSRAWVLVRNPRFRQWSAQAQPNGYPDRIVLRLGIAPGAAVDEIERGRADLMLSPPPIGRIHELSTRYANLLHTYPLGATYALFLNTRTRPFSVLAARQAVNYAIDRAKVVQLAGGSKSANTTCQVLPPTLPGYQPYCPYTINSGASGAWHAPDLARAEQLVRQSGTFGDKVTVVAASVAVMPVPNLGRYVVSVLRQLGYRASLRTIANQQSYWDTISDSRNHSQIGEFPWFNDYPAPWSFFGPLLSCRSFAPNSPYNVNESEFCDPRIDGQARRALRAQASAPATAMRLWAEVDRELVGQAPWVPLCNPRALVVLSARVGNYQFHSFWDLLIDQLWVR